MDATTPSDPLMTVAQAAAVLKKTKGRVYQLIDEKKLDVELFGDNGSIMLVRKSVVETYAAGQEKEKQSRRPKAPKPTPAQKSTNAVAA